MIYQPVVCLWSLFKHLFICLWACVWAHAHHGVWCEDQKRTQRNWFSSYPTWVLGDRTPAIRMEDWDFTYGVTSLSLASSRLNDGPIPHNVNRLSSCALAHSLGWVGYWLGWIGCPKRTHSHAWVLSQDSCVAATPSCVGLTPLSDFHLAFLWCWSLPRGQSRT